MYETGLVAQVSQTQPGLPSLELRFREARLDTRAHIWADAARPDLIRSLAVAGYNVAAARKEKDSVLHGIDLLRSRNLRVARCSQNLQRELEQYVWKRDRATGQWQDEPEDAWNHGVDAIRYWALEELCPRREAPAGPIRVRTTMQRW